VGITVCGRADVAAVGTEPAAEEMFRFPDEGEEGGLLLIRRGAGGRLPSIDRYIDG
jgi:hypothetical protein